MDCIEADFYKVLFEDLDPSRLRKRFLKLLLTLQNVERGSIWVQQKNKYLCIESLGGPSRIDIIKGAAISTEKSSIVGWVMTHGEMTIAEVGKDQRHYQEFETEMSIKSTRILAFPLILRNKEIYGVVQIVDTSPEKERLNLNQQYLKLLKSIIDMGAIALGDALAHSEQVKRNTELEQTLDEIRSEVQIIGQSPAFLKAMKNVREYARTDFPVLITGESGTGKDLVAQALHNLSARRKKPFVVQNCSAIPETLLESELFGYKKGAFTGANENKRGLLMAANGGTVFMDEIGDMSLNLQARILRVIQNNEIKPLGESTTRKVNVRIISATNKDLKQAIESKIFREDLYYRLNVLPLKLPPLKERAKDIPLLLNYFIKREALELGIPAKKISSEAINLLMAYKWGGNIRELENFVKYILSTVEGPTVSVTDLPEHFLPQKSAPAAVDFDTGGAKEPLSSPSETIQPENRGPLTDYTWEKLEKQYILELLSHHNWVVSRAARAADVNRSTFDARMKKLGIRK